MKLTAAEERDLPAVAELEKAFAHPLSEEELQKLHKNETFRILIWKMDEEIFGHCVLFRVMDEGEITSFTVREDLRGKGVGKAFLTELLEYLRKDGAKIAYLDVRESNEPARRLYRSCGFSELGRRKRFYQDPTEDGIGMGIEL
ncbi:MAG: ribosomal protein S18-alanine N-acetyltransferase [Clostridia bacterium]|nr:ribosomal protein S18-alanine N-acetyltransferase [Clostridia bacterium]